MPLYAKGMREEQMEDNKTDEVRSAIATPQSQKEGRKIASYGFATESPVMRNHHDPNKIHPKRIAMKRSTKSKARPGLRKGKWTKDEEDYAYRLAHYFHKGLLPINKGTMLRLFLAEQLNCEPMRVTKKFSGSSCIGKQIYRPCEPTLETTAETAMALKELETLQLNCRVSVNEKSFCASVDKAISDRNAMDENNQDDISVSLQKASEKTTHKRRRISCSPKIIHRPPKIRSDIDDTKAGSLLMGFLSTVQHDMRHAIQESLNV